MAKTQKAKKAVDEVVGNKSKRPKEPGMFRRGVMQKVKGRKVLSRLCRLCNGKKIMLHIRLGEGK